MAENEGNPTDEAPEKDVQGDGNQPDAGATDEQPTEEPKKEKLFTQDDLNRIIPQRAQQAVRSFLKDVGVEDEDELKNIVSTYQQIQEEQKSELQKAQERADKAEREREAALTRAQDMLLQSAFLAEAAKVGAAHPEDAFHLADLGVVTVGEDGTVSGVDKAVQLLVDQGRLVMAGKPKPPGLDGGAGSGQRPSEEKVDLTEAELEVARKLGVKPEDYAKYKNK
jgi:hypothetical protein